MKKLSRFIIQLAIYLYLRLHIYELRTRWHRLWNDVSISDELPVVEDPGEIVPLLRGTGWRAEAWDEFGKPLCSPRRVLYRILYEDETHPLRGGADELSVFMAAVMDRSIKEGKWKSRTTSPAILTVTWEDVRGKVGGINVCLVYWTVGDQPVSGMWGYTVGDLPTYYGPLLNVIEAIKKRYGGPGGRVLVWAIHEPDMSFGEAHWG